MKPPAPQKKKDISPSFVYNVDNSCKSAIICCHDEKKEYCRLVRFLMNYIFCQGPISRVKFILLLLLASFPEIFMHTFPGLLTLWHDKRKEASQVQRYRMVFLCLHLVGEKEFFCRSHFCGEKLKR